METFSKCEMTSIRDLFFSSCSRRDGLSACAQLLAKWIQWDDAFLETESRGWGEEKKVKSLSCVWLFVIPWTVVNQAPPFMGLSRQGYWNELPFPSLGYLPDPGIEPRSPALQADSLPVEAPKVKWSLLLLLLLLSRFSSDHWKEIKRGQVGRKREVKSTAERKNTWLK